RSNEKTESHYIKKEVNVTFKTLPSTKEIKRITQEINGTIIKKLNSTIVFSSNTLSTKELIEYFNRQAMVEFAEYLYLQNQIGLPNDLLYREQCQWNLSATQAEAGWDITKGDEHIIIAVIDTGVDLDHPDLRRRITNGYNVLLNNNFP